MFPKPGRIETVKKTGTGYRIKVLLEIGRHKWVDTDKKFKVGDKVYITFDRLNMQPVMVLTTEDLVEEVKIEIEGFPEYPFVEIDDDYGASCD